MLIKFTANNHNYHFKPKDKCLLCLDLYLMIATFIHFVNQFFSINPKHANKST